MALRCLPPELLSGILRLLDSPRDLLSLIIASPRCRAAFNSAPTIFITSALRNAIEPEALPYALAAIRLLAIEPTQSEALDSFLKAYFGKCSFAFPADMAGLRLLCRLYICVSFFIDDYSSRAMRTMTSDPSPSPAIMSPLSRTKSARFQRAFFWYEIYCALFPTAPRECIVGLKVQASRFLTHLAIWEVEEISCVHFYLTTFMGNYINRLEN